MNKSISSTLFLVLLAVMLLLSGFLDREEKEVRHIVAFKYKANVSEAQIKKVNKAFKKLKNKIPGILSLEIGTNYDANNLNPEFTHTYMLTFANEQARDAYLPHPEHKKFAQLLNQLNMVERSFEMAYSPLK